MTVPHPLGTFCRRSIAITLMACAVACPVLAVETSLSGFGTVGFARSNVDYTFQRYIASDGTFRRDSLAGLQVDAILGNGVGATAQVMVAPSTGNDRRYQGDISWGFLSWRPTNDWLVRAGRQRIPLYLNSQNYDIGVTYDFARLPTEMYSISPGNEFNGLSIEKNWSTGRSEIVVDGYWGAARVDGRFWFRDGIPSIQNAGAQFREVKLKGHGLIVSFKSDENVYRLGWHRAAGRQANGAPLPATYPFVSLSPGVGFYQVSDLLPGPGVPSVNRISNTIATIAAEIVVGGGLRIVGEFARTYVNTPGVEIANASDRGYISLLKSIDKWTPYLLFAFLRTDQDQLQLYERVNRNTVPTTTPGAAIINSAQRAGADGMQTYDQQSWALGTSYALSPTSKLKAELMRVRIGQVSSLVDAPPGSNIRNQHINVISLSYSMVF